MVHRRRFKLIIRPVFQPKVERRSPLDVKIQLLWWKREPLPSGLRLAIVEQGTRRKVGSWDDLDGGWQELGLSGGGRHQVRCLSRVVRPGFMSGYNPSNRKYVVDVYSGDKRLARTSFRTTPASLDEETYRVFVGSCYFGSRFNVPATSSNSKSGREVTAYAKGELNVAKAFNTIVKQRGDFHLSVLLGDQVYVDQPTFGKFGYEHPSTDEVYQRFSASYRRSWHQLGNILTRAPSMTLVDDHEYWNDYPFLPTSPGPWAAIRSSGDFRRVWTRTARSFQAALQPSPGFSSWTVGDELSLGVLDTRSKRTKARIAPKSWIDACVAWLEGLQRPGVLFLSQPFFGSPVSRYLGLILSDHNLPFFADYWRIGEAMSRIPHDILIVSGDVHHGRVSELHTDTRRVMEVTTSPMRALPEATSSWQKAAHRDDYWPEAYISTSNGSFRQTTGRHRGIKIRKVEHLVDVPLTSEGDRVENSIVTLGFRRGPRGAVSCDVECWLVDRLHKARGGEPLAWRRTLDLW